MNKIMNDNTQLMSTKSGMENKFITDIILQHLTSRTCKQQSDCACYSKNFMITITLLSHNQLINWVLKVDTGEGFRLTGQSLKHLC